MRVCVCVYIYIYTVGIIYINIGRIISVASNILFDGENNSFEASLVIYINSISIPPIIIMNRI